MLVLGSLATYIAGSALTQNTSLIIKLLFN